MKIAVFFTFDYSIKLLKESGIFEREMRIYKELSKFGISFTFITYDEDFREINDENNFKFISIYKYIEKPSNKVLRIIKSLIVPYKLKADLLDVDILHQHQLMGSWIPISLKKILNKPLLIRTGYDAYLFSIQNSETYIKRYFYKLLTRYSLSNCDVYTATSICDINFLKETFGDFNIRLIPNFIEENSKKVKEIYTDRILMVGRLENQKNYSEAINFLERFNKNFTIDIYGSGSLLSELSKTILSKNLNINLLGNINHEELNLNYKKYKYFLSTSLFEGNPKTVLEALNNGCIVFASNIPNHNEIISDQINGYLFDNIDELCLKFQKCLDDESIKKKFESKNQNMLKSNTLTSVSKKMFEDYRFLISFK